MNEKIMLMIVVSFMFGLLCGLLLSWICTSKESEIMAQRIKKLETEKNEVYKELAGYIIKDIKKELRDE